MKASNYLIFQGIFLMCLYVLFKDRVFSIAGIGSVFIAHSIQLFLVYDRIINTSIASFSKKNTDHYSHFWISSITIALELFICAKLYSIGMYVEFTLWIGALLIQHRLDIVTSGINGALFKKGAFYEH